MSQAAIASALPELEQVISDGLRTFVEVGRALARIRDEKLYGTEYKNFEAYCAARWDFTKGRASQLITAAGVVDTVYNCKPKIDPPAHESHARELAKLDAKEQPKAWAEAVKTAPDGVVTAKHVASVVEARLPKPTPPIVSAPPANEALKSAAPDPKQWWVCPISSCNREYNREQATKFGWIKRGFCDDCEAAPAPEEANDDEMSVVSVVPPPDAALLADDLTDAVVRALVDAIERWPTERSLEQLIDAAECQLDIAREHDARRKKAS